MVPRTRYQAVLTGLLVPILAAMTAYGLALASRDTPAAAIASAIAQTRATGAYHVTVDAQQTLIPRASTAEIGKRDQRTSGRLEGDVVYPRRASGDRSPDARLHLTTDQNGPALALLLVEGKTYLGYQDRWQLVEAPPGWAAPDEDYLGYLAAVVNVAEMEPVKTAGGALARYSFGIDGPAYAAYQLARMEHVLADQLPRGVQPAPSAQFQQMTGQGELWVDAEGHARRQILDLAMPSLNGKADVQLRLSVDFTRFGDAVPPIIAPIAGPDGSLTLPASGVSDTASAPPPFGLLDTEHLNTSTLDIRHLTAVVVLVLALLFCAALVVPRCHRRLYRAVVIAVIVSMVASPLSSVAQVVRFQDQVAQAAPLQGMLSHMGVLSANSPGQTAAASLPSLPSLPSASSAASPSADPATDLRDCRVLYADSFNASDDTDQDGLSNGDEWCIGTDFRQADSDGDSITDTLELAGYTDSQGKHWTLNPLLDDTNQDGMGDGQTCSVNPSTSTLVCSDPDGDGLPDVWDEDIDQDGVPNRYDLSPFGIPDPTSPGRRYTPAYRPAIDLTIGGAYTGSVVYVDLQVQPITASHLRYTTTWLDWPDDSQGQIQDLDHSTQDVQLIPVLEFKSTIKPQLANLYAMVAVTVTEQAETYYRLWVPLQPLAVGGQITAFSSHIALTAQEIGASLTLRDGRIAWLVRANLDSWTNCTNANGPQNAQNCQVQIAPSVIAQYYDSQLRVSGMTLTESADVQVAQFGAPPPTTPTLPTAGKLDEGRVMLNLMSGLAPSFLGYTQPTLSQIVQNFNAPGAAPYDVTWNITPTLIAAQYNTYTHRDQALATTTMTTTAQFLNSRYQTCTAMTTGLLTPTLALGYQEATGSMDMGHPLVTTSNTDPSIQTLANAQFTVPLKRAAISILRRVQMSQYGCVIDRATQRPTWQALDINQAFNELARRYPNPLSSSEWTLVRLLFTTYYFGLARVVSVNGRSMPYMGSVADPASFGVWNANARGTSTLPDYVRTAYRLDQLLIDLSNRGATSMVRAWDEMLGPEAFWEYFVPMFGVAFIKLVYYTVRVYRALPATFTVSDDFAFTFADAPATLDEDIPRLERLGFALNAAWRNWSGTKPAETQAAAHDEVEVEIDADIIDEKGVAAESKSFDRSMDGLGVLLLVAFTIEIWAHYGLDGVKLAGIARDEALVSSIASTILNILTWAFDVFLSLAGASGGLAVVIEVVLYIIIYLIIGIVTHDWDPLNVLSEIIEWLVGLFLKIDLLVNTPEVGSAPPNLQLDTGSALSQGAVVGSNFELTMTTVTTLTANTNVEHVETSGWFSTRQWANGRQGNLDDVKSSWAFASIDADPAFNNGQAPSWTKNYQLSNAVEINDAMSAEEKAEQAATHCDQADAVDAQGSKTCRNIMSVSLQVSQAGRNLLLPFLNQVQANLAYQKCTGFIWYGCSSDHNYSAGPTQDQDPASFADARSKLYLDTLPDSIDALWTWDVNDPVQGTKSTTWNLDQDADALDDSLEAQYQTDPTQWDTDGDSLADGYEVYVSKTKANQADTDGDGLDDGFEVKLGLNPTNADTDGDGLLDGEEVCHLNPDRSLSGGWEARLPSGAAYHVCSDPNKADEDADGIKDLQERQGATSPWSPNTAPGLFLAVTPSVAYHGSRYTIVKPGGTLTVNLNVANTTADPLDKPMRLTYDTASVSQLTVSSQTGSAGYTPPTPTQGSAGLSWKLTQQPLYTAEAMTSTLQATIAATVAESTRTTLLATVPYTDHILNQARVMSGTVEVRIDAEAPTSLVTSPTANQAINAGTLVIGGAASDATSWPVKVETQISGASYPGGQPYSSGWQTATGTEAWSYAWTVPPDGPYTIRTRATDYVGNVETAGQGTAVIVDKTAPGASFTNVTDGAALTGIVNHTFTLRGAATDLLSGSPVVAGLSVIQLSLDRRPWRNVAEFPSAPPTTATWQYDWQVDNDAYGSHTLAVRAVDALGQVGRATEIKVIVDNLPPSDIWSNASPQVRAGQTVTFEGHADDTGNVPLPARPQPLEGGVGSAAIDPLQKATVWLMPNGPTEDITKTVVWLGDVNGDARADFAVGTPGSAVNGKANAGRVSIVYGKPGGWAVTPAAEALTNAASQIEGSAGAALGTYIAPAGDVNGDGLSDFLVGDPLNNQVYLIFGQTGPLGKLDPTTLKNPTLGARGKIFTVNAGKIGQWLASAGDVNGDGFDDLLIGVTGLSSGMGVVYLVLGSDPTKGALGKGQLFSLDALPPMAPIVAAVFSTDNNGVPAVGVGDLNGDQYADFVIADPANALGGSPAVYVFLGGVGYQPRKTPTPANPSQAANASFRSASGIGSQVIPLGDVNGDGLPDFAYSDGATPRIVYGRASGWQMGMTSSVTFSGYTPVPNGPLAGVGDVNADGKNDLLLGTMSGRAYLVLGRADLATNQPVQAELDNVGAVASAPFAAGADVNCDASSDLLIVPFGFQAAANKTAAREARRALRSELALGPSPAPIPLDKLPIFGPEFSVLRAEAKTLRDSLSKLSTQHSALSTQLFVDDDYCQTCANDGHTWGTNAFASLQAAVDKAGVGNTILIGPGSYGPVNVPAGKHNLTLQGVDADAVFLDAAGGVGVQIGSPNDATGIQGVTVQGLTIRNASAALRVDYGGTPGSNDLNDPTTIRIHNTLIYLDKANSKGVDMYTSNVDLRHNTLVADSSGVSLVSNNGAIATATYLRDNLLVALPNAAPLPQWWQQNNVAPTASLLNTHNGFASPNGADADWLTPPAGASLTKMTLVQARFSNAARRVFRLLEGSAAIGQANENGDLGYYTYHGPVYVSPTYCEKCSNQGRLWNVTAFNDIQSAITSGAQRILVEPGLYRERLYLVNGVAIFGSGAALTVIAPPSGSSPTIVGAEGVQDASLALVTLAGDGQQDGLRLDAGAQVDLTRAIIRNTATAVHIDGAAGGATASLANNTLVGNQNGVLAVNCGNLEVRNTVFAFNKGIALSYGACATTKSHNFNAYWRNGQDQAIPADDSPGQGNVYADPRFENPNQLDYRPQATSPLVDAGDPSDPTPPGSGGRVDIGYVQAASAAVYVSPRYCEQCLNDGLEWGVDAFTTVQDGVDHIPAIGGVFTVGVDAGTYTEQVSLRSGVRLIGSGADTTVIDAGGSGSALTLDGVTNVEVTGFTLQNAAGGATNAAVVVAGFSNNITITHNILTSNQGAAASFSNASSGVFLFNTVTNNPGSGLVVTDPDTWVHVRFNIFASNTGAGMSASNQAQVFNSYNLFYQNSGGDTAGAITLDATSIQGKDPLFVNADPSAPDYSLQVGSPALDAIAAHDWQPVPTGGGSRADLGYRELLATPITLLFGKQADTCAAGVSGVASVQVGFSRVTDPGQDPDTTLPTAWYTATLSTAGQPGSYWTLPVNLASGGGVYQGDGLYRLYTRPMDVSGNQAAGSRLYRAAFIADGAPPTVTLSEPPATLTTTAPAIHLAATVSDTVPIGASMQDNIARVYFEVDGAVVKAAPVLGASGQYGGMAALADGSHTVTAVAVDRAGNVGRSPAASVIVSTSQNEATLLLPAPNSAVVSTTVTLAGAVHFAATDGDGQVEVLVDGVSRGLATLDNPRAQATTWTKPVTLASEGSHTLILRASRPTTSNPHDTTVTLTKDSVAPTLDIRATTEPITRTLILNGTFSDATSGVGAVDVSVDGGFTWASATELVNNTWTYVYHAGLGLDYTRFPLRVRATDRAGNTFVQSGFFIVDNLGPSPFITTASPNPGVHLTAPAQVSLFWAPLHDGSGEPTTIAVVDQHSDTIPSSGTPFVGRSYTAQFPSAGTWYVHLQAVDKVGNTTTRHYGPWFVGSSGTSLAEVARAEETLRSAQSDNQGLAQAEWQSSVVVDGLMDMERGEWHLATERLDVDPRLARHQSLWATFDATHLYLGWRGARWGIDGTGYIYLDTQPGGSATPWTGPDGEAVLSGKTLPFAADYVVYLTTSGGGVRHWDGSAWQPISLSEGRAGPNGDTELTLSWSGLGTSASNADLRLLAFDDDHGQIISVFPTDQSALGPWTSAYHWSGLTPTTIPNAGQPQGTHVSLRVAPPRWQAPVVGPDSAVLFVLNLTNLDQAPVTDLVLDLAASPGLTLQSIQGAPSQPPGLHWSIPFASLAPGAAAPITVTTRLASDVSQVTAMTLTGEVKTSTPSGVVALAQSRTSLAVDNTGPVVRLSLPNGATLRSGAQVLRGTASDRSGVGFVEVKVGDGPWRTTPSDVGGIFTNLVWGIGIDVPPSGEVVVQARAHDIFGQTGPTVSATLSVDNVPPTASLTLTSALLRGASAILSGTTRDGYPQDGPVDRVEVQIDNGSWRLAPGLYLPTGGGGRGWRYTWRLPAEEGVQRQVRVRATDAAGNVGAPSDPVTVTVDSVPPVSQIAYPQAGARIPEACLTLSEGEALLWGTVADGMATGTVQVSIDGGQTWRAARLGAEAAALLARTLCGGTAAEAVDSERPLTRLWAITLPAPDGELALRSRAVDAAGNVEALKAPVRVQHVGGQRPTWRLYFPTIQFRAIPSR